MITNTKIFGNSLDKDIDKEFFDEYALAPSEFAKVFHVQSAPAGDHYTWSELSPLGQLREISEGGQVEFDLPEAGHKVTKYYRIFGLGFQITAPMYKDDLTGNWKQMPRKLAKSAGQKPDIVAFDVFNNGFTSETSADGQYIFDVDHTTLKSGDTIANEPATAGSLSETTLQAGFEYFDGLVDEAGNPLNIQPNKLLVPIEQKYAAQKLMKNVGAIGTANNDLNVVSPTNGIVNDYMLHVSRYLTSSTAWFLLSPEHMFTFMWKDQAALSSTDDFSTNNALFKVWMRFAAFCLDYKGGYGNPGA